MSDLTPYAHDLYHKKLKAAKASDTTARSAVFGMLYKNGHTPLTMHDLIRLTEDYADRASVYRSVKLLEKIGIIRRMHIGWKYKLELSDDFHGHHHHITCVKCSETHATHYDEKLETLLAKLAAKHDFFITDHQLDIKGVCSNCQKK